MQCMGGLRPVSRQRPIRVTDVGLWPTQPIPRIGAISYIIGVILSFCGSMELHGDILSFGHYWSYFFTSELVQNITGAEE